MRVKSEVVRAILSTTKKKGRTNDMRKYITKQAACGRTISTLGGDYALKWDDETQMSVNAHAALLSQFAKAVRRAFRRLLSDAGAWRDSSDGWQCAERDVRLDSWEKARRMVFARHPAEKMPKRKKA